MIIYKVTNLKNGKLYIGKTKRKLAYRWHEHQQPNGCVALYRAIKKYGVKNFKIEIITGANSESELNYLEQHYIYIYNSLSPNGYNLTTGGEKYENSQETIIRKTEANRKTSQRPEIRAARSKTKKQHFIDHPEAAQEHSEKLKKKYKDDPSLKEKNSIATGGKPFKVFKKDTMELIWEGINQQECARVLGVGQGNINNCLNFKKKSSNGYIFRFCGEENRVWMDTNGRSRKIINLETREIFNSLREASLKYGNKKNGSNINYSIKNKTTAYGYHWEYYVISTS